MTDLSSQSPSIQTIYGWYRSGRLVVNRAYQRKLVWTLVERQKLIDSIEKKYPIPLVLLAEIQSGDSTVYEIIDVLQRLHSIMSFIENGFPDEQGKYFNVDEFLTAKDAAEKGIFHKIESDDLLEREVISRILDYSLPVSIIKNADSGVITDVFGRINTYGHRLSDQEQRQAGQLTELARFVRRLSSELRGDASVETLPLHNMPEISIDLPKSRAGYSVKAEEVWWVKQGVLRSTDLRDSMDEQLLADWVICAVDKITERAKDVLDAAFDPSHTDGARIAAALQAIGQDSLGKQFKFCIDTIGTIVEKSSNPTLSRLVFEQTTNNSFATLFVTISMAVYELVFKEQLLPADHKSISECLNNVNTRMSNARTADARRRNVDVVKGLIRAGFTPGDISKVVYSGNRSFDLVNIIRRSKIENSHFETKQGILRLSDGQSQDDNLFDKINETICGIANNALTHDGCIIIGIADKQSDVERIKMLHDVDGKEIDGHFIVGIDREATALSITLEAYFQRWRDSIEKSKLSDGLKADVLSRMAICEIEDLSVLLIPIPCQAQPSFLDGKLYYRKGDQTCEASAETAVSIASRFK